MLDRPAAVQALQKLFRRRLVADIDGLFDVLQTRSRMSVFRRLREVGYRSSYTHAGRYYTLEAIPRFDERGLWFHQDVGFSRWGTLKATLVAWMEGAPAGFTHEELEGLLHLRVHNTLLGLVHEGQVGRAIWEGAYLYVSPDPVRAADQRARRVEGPEGQAAALALAPATVIEVLVEALQAGRVRVSAGLVAARLGARGVRVSQEQVGAVLERYRVETEKKRRGPRSARGSKGAGGRRGTERARAMPEPSGGESGRGGSVGGVPGLRGAYSGEGGHRFRRCRPGGRSEATLVSKS